MRKGLFIIAAAVVFLVSGSCQFGFGQTTGDKLTDNQTIGIPEPYQTSSLESDLRSADLVVHLLITSVTIADSTPSADCKYNRGPGYCSYYLEAEIKEMFKGEITGKTLNFYTSAEASFPKNAFIGERVVFLTADETSSPNAESYSTIENSTRKIEHNVIERLRAIINRTENPAERSNFSKKPFLKTFPMAELNILPRHRF